MKITKSELKEMIREALREELSKTKLNKSTNNAKVMHEATTASQWRANLKMIRKYLVEVGGIEFYAEDLEDTFAVWFLGHELGDESFGIFDLNTLSITDEINSSDAVAIYDDLEEFFAYNEEAYEVCLEIAKKYYNK